MYMVNKGDFSCKTDSEPSLRHILSSLKSGYRVTIYKELSNEVKIIDGEWGEFTQDSKDKIVSYLNEHPDEYPEDCLFLAFDEGFGLRKIGEGSALEIGFEKGLWFAGCVITLRDLGATNKEIADWIDKYILLGKFGPESVEGEVRALYEEYDKLYRACARLGISQIKDETIHWTDGSITNDVKNIGDIWDHLIQHVIDDCKLIMKHV